MTASEDLVYYVVIAVDGFDFDAWDLDWSNPNILDADTALVTEPGVINYRTNFDIVINQNYELALYVQDMAENLSRYTPADLIYAD